MTSVDEAFDRFRADFRAGAAADARHYLEGLPVAQRRELAALMDAFVTAAPGDPFEPEAFAAYTASPERAQLRAALDARLAESWPTLLPQARDAAELSRATLVSLLADALGVGAHRDRVATYYHRMETGRLPARGVSDRVLDALGAILGLPAERLRAAGAAPRPAQAGGGAVFARAPKVALEAPAPAAAAAAPPPDLDEVDRLFIDSEGP